MHVSITYVDIKKAQTGFITYKRYGIRSRRNYRNLPQTLGDRTVIQADKTELSLEILLWGKCKCYQDTVLGYTYSQPVAYGNENGTESFLELLWPCNHDENYTYVLYGFLQSVQSSGKGLENSFVRELEGRLSTIYFLMGLGITK